MCLRFSIQQIHFPLFFFVRFFHQSSQLSRLMLPVVIILDYNRSAVLDLQ